MRDRIIKYRLLIVITSVAITILMLLAIPKLRVNANVDDYVPDTIRNKVYLKKLDSIFGGSEMILVMLHTEDVVNRSTHKRLEALNAEFMKLEGIDRTISPFDAQEISYEDGFISMESFFEDLPEDKAFYASLRRKIALNSMINRFYSDDFSLVTLVLSKNTKTPDTIIESIKEVVAKYPGPEEVIIGGLPFIRYSIAGNIQSDLVFLLPIAMFLMILMLYFSFREWKGVFMPFLIVVMSIILSFGLMAVLGWQISLFSILMPIMIIAIANDYGIHLIARYQELARSAELLTMKQISRQIYVDLKKPILITGFTTIGGILGLLTHKMIPAAQLGVLTAIGIVFALLLSLYFLPAMLSYFRLKKTWPAKVENQNTMVDKLLRQFARWVVSHPKKIIWIAMLMAGIGIVGTFFLKVDTNVESYFSATSEVGRSTMLINEKFGGSQFISVLFTGEVLAPEVLRRMEVYEKEIVKDSAVGYVNSPVTIIKELSKGFYLPEEEGYNQIPETADEVYQLIEVFALGGNEDALMQFMDYDYKNAWIIISMKDASNAAGKRLLDKLNSITARDANVQFVAGASLTAIELADLVVRGQINSLILAMVVIFVLLSLVFGSPRAGLVSGLPLSIAILILFGLMGIFGIAIDIANALLTSIMIGVGVDYTVHFLWRFKEEHGKGLGYKDAIRHTMSTSGRGIIINAASVVFGFLPLLFSNFKPLQFFGALIVLSITACLVSSLLLVPAIILLTKPKFLGNSKIKTIFKN